MPIFLCKVLTIRSGCAIVCAVRIVGKTVRIGYTMISKFVQKLEEKRGQESMRRFAKDLGVSGALWSRIVRGIHRPGPKVIDAALARWPELAYYLAEDARADHDQARKAS